MTNDSGRVPAAPGLRGFAPEPLSASQPEALVPSREARCPHCLKLVPSNPSLAFFEDRGAGSRAATKLCRTCKCYEVAHHPRGDDAPAGLRGIIPNIIGAPHAFEPHGAWEFDLFYCGCRGWD